MARTSREIYWSAILADFRRSGLTHVEFCRLRRISLHSFRKWLYHLRPGLPPKATRARSQTSAVPAPQTTTTTPRFLPVHIRTQALSQANDHEGTSSSTVPLELVLPSDCRILVRPGFDPRCLRQLLDCLDGEPSSCSASLPPSASTSALNPPTCAAPSTAWPR